MFQSHRRNPFIKSFVWPYCEMQVGPRTSQPHPCYLIFYLTTAEYRFYIWLCLFVVELCCFIFTFFSLLLIYLSGMKKNIYGNLIKTHHSHGMHLSISEANKKKVDEFPTKPQTFIVSFLLGSIQVFIHSISLQADILLRIIEKQHFQHLTIDFLHITRPNSRKWGWENLFFYNNIQLVQGSRATRCRGLQSKR